MDSQTGSASSAEGGDLDLERLPPAELVARVRRLQDERAALERAAEDRDELMSVLSHELRSPLNAVLGWAQMLGGGDVDAEMLRKATLSIERNSRQQARTIEEVLDLTRVEAGKLALDVQVLSMDDVIGAALDAVAPAAREKGVALEGPTEPVAAFIRADAARLERALENLIAHSIQATPRGGRVQVAAHRRGDFVELSIVDSGRGLTPERLAALFPDRRGQAARVSLPLAVARAFLELQSGRVHAESEGAGKGSRFVVELPTPEASAHVASSVPSPPSPVPAAAPKALATPKATEPSPTSLAMLGLSRSRSSPGTLGFLGSSSTPGLMTSGVVPPTPGESLDGIEVVVVDDEPDAREVIAAMLRHAGAGVRIAASALEALELVQKTSPLVLVSDIAMPVHDGYELVRRVRDLPDGRGLKVGAVAVTAFASRADRERALGLGFDEHLPKPVDVMDLVRVVNNLAARARSLRT